MPVQVIQPRRSPLYDFTRNECEWLAMIGMSAIRAAEAMRDGARGELGSGPSAPITREQERLITEIESLDRKLVIKAQRCRV